MARVSKEAKAQSNAKIVDEAARLFREYGIEGTGLADVMAAAGLTHGGFYRHFSSKDELAAAAIGKAIDGYACTLEDDIVKRGANRAITRYIDLYLSEKHVTTPGDGCPLAAVGAECGRGPMVCKEAIARGTRRFVELLAQGFDDEPKEARARAVSLLSTLIGTVVLARSATSTKSMNDILSAGRQFAMRCMSS